MKAGSAAPVAAKFDPIAFTIAKPLASPRELAIAFGDLIDSISDLTGVKVDRVVTPGLGAITVSWAMPTVPSAQWLSDVELQLHAFGAIAGVGVRFRRH
ncbi:MAG: hypothetical protein JO101_05840 [Candidatus Eremiobacteraeota bacterium]|nr:hypothetical protein [Candidatus Eremiobacteraeota bacterium]